MDNMSVFLGTVVSTAPEYGIAIVDVMGGAEQQTRTLIGYLPCNDSATGTVTHQIIPTGSTVICASIHEDDEVTYIISQANYMVADVDNSLLGRANYDIGSIVARDYTAIDTVLIQLLQDRITFLNNHAHNMDIDAMTGDFDVRDYDGEAGIHIGKYISQLRGSSMAYIDLAGISDRIRMVASTIEQHTPIIFDTTREYIRSNNIAINATEAFGILNGESPIEIKDDIPELKYEDAIPLYRLQKKAGAAVGGEEDIIIIPPRDTDTHTAKTEPIVVAKKRSAFNGLLSSHSANSILSIKSPDILGLHQVAYNEEIDPPQDDILIPYNIPKEDYYDTASADANKKELSDDELEEAIRDAALNKLVETITSEEYLDKLIEKLGEHGLKLASTENTLDKTMLKAANSPIQPTVESSYKAPLSIDVIDPATGEMTRYYKSTSFISQEPDGSILLKDGYGSEIRMSQGNIYISPALDLFLRPGRDLSAMTPRHQSFNSQYSCTINSGDSIYIRAADNLKAIAGTSGAGSLTLENNSTGIVDDKFPGINIKSSAGVAMTGAHVYIGGKPSTELTKNKATADNTIVSTIVLDSGNNGSMLLKSGAHTVDSKQMVFACHDGSFSNAETDFATALAITPSSIGMYTTTVLMPAHLSLRGLKETETVTLYHDGDQKALNIKTANKPTVAIAGNFICYGEGTFKEKVAASMVVSTSESNVLAHRNPAKAKKFFTDLKLQKDVVVGSFGKTCAANIQIAASNGPYQNWFVNGNAFSFPLSYNVDTAITIPGMCWQRDAYKSSSGSYKDYVWNEIYIKDTEGNNTACYPGIDIWEKASLSLGKDKEDKTIKVALKSSYITTTPKKNRK